MKKISFYSILSLSLILSACSMFGKKGTGVNLFTVAQDKQFGADVAAEIDGNPTEYPLLDSVQYKMCTSTFTKFGIKFLIQDKFYTKMILRGDYVLSMTIKQ